MRSRVLNTRCKETKTIVVAFIFTCLKYVRNVFIICEHANLECVRVACGSRGVNQGGIGGLYYTLFVFVWLCHKHKNTC